MTCSVLFGISNLTWDTLSHLFEKDQLIYQLVWNIRLPRALLAFLLGTFLAASGCLMQGITRNPLSEPEIMGVNQGAAFFAVCGLILFPSLPTSPVLFISALIGGAVGGSVVYILSLSTVYSGNRLVLAGIAVSFFMGALTTGVILVRENQLYDILYWMAGKLSGAQWQDILIALWVGLPSLVLCLFLAHRLNILALGEEAAQGLGERTRYTRRIAALLVIVLVGICVALAGPIGFIGLMVPHMARFLVGPDFRAVLPLSMLIGGNLLLLADFAGQWIIYPTDIPVGIITALMGSPFFLYLIHQQRRNKNAASSS
jgi:iron complex transport system permease protein